MKAGAPPLRFLVLVLGGWICVRAAILIPHGSEEKRPAPAASVPLKKSTPTDRVTVQYAGAALAKQHASAVSIKVEPGVRAHSQGRQELHDAQVPFVKPDIFRARARPVPANAPEAALPAGFALSPPTRTDSRWTGSAWLFAREGGGAALVPSGILGGSQIGGRLGYRLNDDPKQPLALVGRASAPVNDPGGAEAALGIEWQPTHHLPVRLLAERRQAIGDTGRSAFSLLAYGGFGDRELVGPVLLDAYGQAGIVGLRSRDMFADGSVRMSVRAGERAKIGIGLWGAVQPRVSRIDIGPQASFRLPVAGAGVTVAADWRFRIAGDARPNSGPALTLATDF